MAERQSQYKNVGKSTEVLRKSRVDNSVSLHKEKLEGVVAKRRNIPTMEDLNEDDTGAGASSAVTGVLQPPYDEANLQEIVLQAQSLDPDVQMQAVTRARRLLCSDHSPPIDDFISSGILPILVRCLKSTNSTLQIGAAWVLANIASGTRDQTRAVVQADAVPGLVEMLKSNNMNVCEQAVWALGNITGDGPHFHEYCIELGIVEPLLKFAAPEMPLNFLGSVTWVMVNLCRPRDPPQSRQVVQTLLPALAKLIHHQDKSILVDTVWALSYLTDHPVVQYLVPLLGHGEVEVQEAALHAVGNIVTGTDEQKQLVLDCQALEMMPALLNHVEEKIKNEAMRFLSNIRTGNENQLQAVIDASFDSGPTFDSTQ